MHMFSRPWKALLAGGAIAALALTGCAGGEEPSGGEDGLTPISLVSQPNGAGLAMYIATELGYFEDEGLDPEVTFYPSGPASLAAGAAGEWDAGWSGAPPTLSGANSFGLIPAGTMIQEDANHIMFMRASVLEGSSEADVLTSHPVATSQNSLAEQVMRACAEHFGVDPAAVEMVPLDGGQVVQALQSGQVDVANSWSTPDFELLDDPEYEQVCNGELAGVAVICAYVVTPKFAEENPEAAASFLRAVYRANEFIRDNHEEAVDHLLDYYQANGVSGGRDQADYEVRIRDWKTLDQAIAEIENGDTAAALTASAEFFVANGVYPTPPPIDDLLARGLELLTAAKEGAGR